MKSKASSSRYSISVPMWFSEDSEADEEALLVDFEYTPPESAQMYERSGRAPCPGSPAQVEVMQMVRENGAVVEWDDLDEGIQQYIEQTCFEHVAALSSQ